MVWLPSWEFKLVETRSISISQWMKWHYTPTGSENWLKWGQYRNRSHGMILHTHWEWRLVKQGQYQISSWWKGITHPLRVQIYQNKVSIKLAADKMALQTGWDPKRIATWSVMNKQLMDCLYTPAGSLKSSKRRQYWMTNSWTACMHNLRVWSDG